MLRPTSPDGKPGRPSAAAPYLAEPVRDLQRKNIELAGVVGSLQQRLTFADERIRMLEAPSPERPISGDCEQVPREPTQTPSKHRNGRSLALLVKSVKERIGVKASALRAR